MPPVTVNEIKELGRRIVLEHPGGIRFSQIVAAILKARPDAMPNTVGGTIANSLVQSYPGELSKPSRGLYVPLAPEDGVPEPVVPAGHREDEFYEPFADFLQNDLDEATTAVPLGGAGMGGKWGTPDVVGVYRPRTSDLIKFTPEIIAAEVKIDPYQSVVAFGQAVAYRLFATRAYVVMPSTMTPQDQSRMDALCILCGLGFILFDSGNPADPQFQIRVRAQGHPPDAFYVNDFAQRLHEVFPEEFAKLFQ